MEGIIQIDMRDASTIQGVFCVIDRENSESHIVIFIVYLYSTQLWTGSHLTPSNQSVCEVVAQLEGERNVN